MSRGRPRILPDDETLAGLFHTTPVKQLAEELGVSTSVLWHHRRRLNDWKPDAHYGDNEFVGYGKLKCERCGRPYRGHPVGPECVT